MDLKPGHVRARGSHASCRHARVKGKAVKKGTRDEDETMERDGEAGRVSVACPLPPVTRLYICDPLRAL